jgi:hypothetical protein
MPIRTRFAIPALLIAQAFASHAVADVAPPDGYVEECTVAKKTTADTECLECKGLHPGAENAERCTTLLTPYCYTSVCHAYGATVFTEVWCRTKGPEVPTVPDEIAAQLMQTSAPVPVAGDAGTIADTGTCLPYSPPSTSNTSPTGGSSASGSGCAVRRPSARPSLSWCALIGLAASAAIVARRRLRARR